MGLMEEAEFGMDTCSEMRDKYKLPLPIITYDDPDLIFTFPRSAEAVRSLDSTEVLSQLNDEEIAGLDFVKTRVETSRKEYEEYFGFDKKKAERHLGKLVSVGLIGRKGSGPGTYYELITT
jgi:predicted HTH transcriptional regulator